MQPSLQWNINDCYLEDGNTFLGCDVAQDVSPLSLPSEKRGQSRASPRVPYGVPGTVFYSKYFDFSPSLSLRQCSKPIHLSQMLYEVKS